MKSKFFYLIIAIGCACILMSCASTGRFTPGKGNKYRYVYKLTYPVENTDMIFQDDSIIVQFKFDEAAIRFQLQNISDSYLTIEWSKSAIAVGGKFSSVRNMANLYSDTLLQNSILLPSLGYIRDIVMPRHNIYFDGEKWVEVDLLPTMDHNCKDVRDNILKNVGQKVNLSLPLLFGSNEKIYEFEFRVDSVKQVMWRDYMPIPRIPPPPIPKKTITGMDNLTAAIITVGVLGFSAYVLTMKKHPPTE